MNESITPAHLAIFAHHLAACLRAYAQIEGMKAFNAQRLQDGMAVGYSEGHFNDAVRGEGLDPDTMEQTFKHFF